MLDSKSILIGFLRQELSEVISR